MKRSLTAALAISLASLSLAPATTLAAPATTQGTAHFLILDLQDAPIAGATLAGACEASIGPFWNAEKNTARWSCTSDADGVCAATITTLALPDGKPAQCRGTERSTITEKGATPAKISYHAFFPKGVPTSHTLLKKGTAWKDGEYLFKAFSTQEAFESTAFRYRVPYYTQRIQTTALPSGPGSMLSTQAAHHQESSDFQNLAYLTAERSSPGAAPTLRVVVVLTYVDYTFHRYTQAHFAGLGNTASGELTAPLAPRADKTMCNLRDVMERKCTYHETLDLPLDAALARQLASQYASAPHGNWQLRITSANGHERKIPMAYAEFAALVGALDTASKR